MFMEDINGLHMVSLENKGYEDKEVRPLWFDDVERVIMIIRSIAKSRLSGGSPPSTTCVIEFEELCSVCDKYIKNEEPCFRKIETNSVICMECASEIRNVNG
jgi:hypothetical protein